MTVKDIVTKYLKENGYDGLYNEDYCWCEMKNLMPCGDTLSTTSNCEPGYKTKSNIYDCGYHITGRKEE
jgi:hypothetical protein